MENTIDFCLHEGGHSGNDEKGCAPWLRLNEHNDNVVGLAIAYTIASADRELSGVVMKFLSRGAPTRVSLPGSVNG